MVHVCICVRVLSRVCACVGACMFVRVCLLVMARVWVGASSSLKVLYCLKVIFHYPAVVVKNNVL